MRLHFLLLTIFSIGVGFLSRLHFPGNLAALFALCGALHAIALVLTLGAPLPLSRKCLFVATAAALSALMFHLGILAIPLTSVLPGLPGLYSVLGLTAVAGALGYAVLIRLVGIYVLNLRQLAVICVGCALAAYIALISIKHWQALGAWWVAVLWWYAFSGGLWYFIPRRRAVGDSETR